jgi:hypothetical protein
MNFSLDCAKRSSLHSFCYVGRVVEINEGEVERMRLELNVDCFIVPLHHFCGCAKEKIVKSYHIHRLVHITIQSTFVYFQ